MKNAVVWSEIAVSDLKRATAFYEKLLDGEAKASLSVPCRSPQVARACPELRQARGDEPREPEVGEPLRADQVQAGENHCAADERSAEQPSNQCEHDQRLSRGGDDGADAARSFEPGFQAQTMQSRIILSKLAVAAGEGVVIA